MSSSSSKPFRFRGLSWRKAEIKKEAEKQRIDGLQLIRNHNWNNDEGLNATEVFPEEVWEMALDRIKDPQDLESARGACELFRDLLEHRRVRDILLPLALNVKEFRRVLKNTKPDISPSASEDSSVNDEEPPIQQSAFTTLRSVCKRWRDAVDNCFESDINEENFLDRYNQFKPSSIRKPFARDPNLCFAPLIECPWYNLPEENHTVETLISNYSAKLSNNLSPRFPPRALRVLVNLSAEDFDFEGNLEEGEDFLNSITKALELMGGDLQRFMLMEDIHNQHPQHPFIDRATTIYNKLQKWCVLMPNLKWLSLHMYYWFMHPEDKKPALRNVRKAIKKNPFPRMEKLTTLSYESRLTCDTSDGEMLMAVLESNRQINEPYVGRSEYPYLCPALCNMIKSLELISFGVWNNDLGNVVEEGMCMVKDMEAITNFSWQLRLIHLIFKSCDTAYELPIRRLFKFVERFQTLEYVNLEMHVNSVQRTNRIILHLPNLKHFSFKFRQPLIRFLDKRKLAEKLLDGKEFFESIDYLRHCSKLENIHWENHTFHMLHPALTYKRKDQLIDFQGGIFSLQQSNIWDVFPSLKIVKIWKRDSQSRKWVETYKRGCQRAANANKN